MLYSREPWGEYRDDLRTSSMAAFLANAICGALGLKTSYKADRLLRDWWKAEREASPALFLAKLKLIAVRHNAKLAKLEKLGQGTDQG